MKGFSKKTWIFAAMALLVIAVLLVVAAGGRGGISWCETWGRMKQS